MRAGPLDRRIVIQEAVTVQDSLGQPIETWSTFAERWASRMDVTGRERFASQQEIASETTVFRIRWLEGVTRQMRITSEGKTYDIESIAELGRREGLDISATARPV